MLFNSWQFILVFLPIVFFGYFWLNRTRLAVAARAWLAAASLFFYAYWNVSYLPLLLISLLFNFVIGNSFSSGRTSWHRTIPREAMLTFGVTANLALLAYYKYAGFIADMAYLSFSSVSSPTDILLPLAISFFTFNQIAYLVDSYRGEAKEYDFLNYVLFVTFFPHLIAGPIVHHREMMPQFASRWSWAIRYRNVLQGLFIFGIGLFKKVALADTFAIWANSGFDSGRDLDFFAAWATSLSYSFQLYFDFSGYCDMAIGAALLFNIRFPLNFNSPYKALDIQDFWRRWHMTLSRFLRDYLYIPLGGNRRAEFRIHLNLMATFTLGGLWHGASWMFVIWGALHGAAIVAHRLWRIYGRPLPSMLAWLLTFLFVNATWVFFRAKTLDDAVRILRGMINLSSIEMQAANIPVSSLAWAGWLSDSLLRLLPNAMIAYLHVFVMIVAGLVIISRKNSYELAMGRLGMAKVAAGAVLFGVSLLLTIVSTSTEFLYFNF